ncbi:MAG: hypothetical protein P8186_17570, partial [Anaerolineae bacterium]
MLIIVLPVLPNSYSFFPTALVQEHPEKMSDFFLPAVHFYRPEAPSPVLWVEPENERMLLSIAVHHL